MFNQPDVGVAGLFDLGLVIPGRHHGSDQTIRFFKRNMDQIVHRADEQNTNLKKKKKKKIWPLQNHKSFLFPPFTFIWSHDKRLDKRTRSYPKYAPIEQSGSGQETSEVPHVFNVFLASFFGRDQSCCGL